MLPNQGAYWVHAVQWAVAYVGPLMYQTVWLTTTLARSEKHPRAANEQLNLGAQVNLSRSTEQGVEPRGTVVSVTDGCLRMLSVGGGPPILSRCYMPLTSSSLFPPETPNPNFLLSATTEALLNFGRYSTSCGVLPSLSTPSTQDCRSSRDKFSVRGLFAPPSSWGLVPVLFLILFALAPPSPLPVPSPAPAAASS